MTCTREVSESVGNLLRATLSADEIDEDGSMASVLPADKRLSIGGEALNAGNFQGFINIYKSYLISSNHKAFFSSSYDRSEAEGVLFTNIT